MTQSSSSSKGKRVWRSLAELAGADRHDPTRGREFPEGADTLTVDPVSRRQFLTLMGASAALAGTAGTGCLRKPTQLILPFHRRPEDYLPGEPRHYATTLMVGDQVLGAVVTSMDGRPTKIDGNPAHPMSEGSSSVWAQAEVLDLYDPDRSQQVLHRGAGSSWAALEEAIAETRQALGAQRGANAAFVIAARPSPTQQRLVRALQQAYPQARFYDGDALTPWAEREAWAAAGLAGRTPSYQLRTAKTIVSLDADFLATEGPTVALARQFADGRRLRSSSDEMNRLYVIEPAFSVTGMTADHRLALPSSQVGAFAGLLLRKLAEAGLSLPADTSGVLNALPEAPRDAQAERLATVLAEELMSHRGASAIIAGHRQPAWVHGLALILNTALGNLGHTLRVTRDEASVEWQPLSALATASGIETLIVVGGNPAYTAPSDSGYAAAARGAQRVFRLGYHVDETSEGATWHVPQCHGLEAWGDLRAADGTLSLAQPLIAPLFESWSDIEFLARFLDGEAAEGHGLVQATWRAWSEAPLDFDAAWQRWLHDGIVRTGQPTPERPVFGPIVRLVEGAERLPAPGSGAMEVVFQRDPSVADGRYANNGWLQELPDPVTKVTWDNAAQVSPSTAKRLGLNMNTATVLGHERATVVQVRVGGQSLEIPVFVTPGVAADVILLPLGYGRRMQGRVAQMSPGVDVNPLRSVSHAWFRAGAQVEKTRRTHNLATTQNHHSMEGRGLVREATLAGWREQPDFVQEHELMPAYKLNSLWEEPNPRNGQQWGMVIDLTTCLGCNACTVACQAENNIPIVGKERVMMGRELQWIRLDRYFSIDWDREETWEQPEVLSQPIACMHCENAPCEQVCPVAATVHGPEGTNDMVYNRCIGTRYCANNCPFKVRRYNFFNYVKENDALNPLVEMQRNPNVTVRFRGVMEKCTYCIQRVQRAKEQAKVEATGVVADGVIKPACGQACPTQSIVFGDINDPTTEVSRLKRQSRDYVMLSYLNIHPRTSYLGRIRNPNPALA